MEVLTGEDEVDQALAAIELEETVTYLVNEDGNVVLDITDTLSSMEHQQEGNVVFIAMDQPELPANEVACGDQAANVCFPFTPQHFAESCDNLPEETSSRLRHLLTSDIPNQTQSSFQYSNCNEQLQSSHPRPPLPQCLSSAHLNSVDSSQQPVCSTEHQENRFISILPRLANMPSSSSFISNELLSHLTCDNAAKKRKPAVRKRPQLPTADYEAYVLPQSSVIPSPLVQGKKIYVCDQCPSTADATSQRPQFSQFNTLSTHYSRVHQIRLLKEISGQCAEQGCTFKFWRLDEFRHHLTSAHGVPPQEPQKLEFASMEEFEEWKTKEEKTTNSRFIRRSSGSVSCRQNDRNYLYFICQRSGQTKFRAPNQTKKKNMKSNKIDGFCTACINVVHEKKCERITCEYYSIHYGHGCSEPTRHVLTKQEKEWIFQLLLRGWTSDEIVKTLKSGTINGTTDRMRQVNRQDIFNVSRSHDVRKLERRNENDLQSVELWVQELREKSSLSTWNSQANAFSLVVMDEYQVELTRQHGNILYVADLPLALEVDRRYRLIALTTAATERDAYLLAYGLVDQAGSQPLQNVLSAFMAKVGTFQPEFILSSDPYFIASAWSSHSYEVPIFLLPQWTIESDWDSGLAKFIDDDRKREAVKKCVDTLLAERDPDKFSAFLQLFTGMLAADESLLSFSRFFAASYSSVAAHWPGFHRLPDCSALIRLNGELELIVRRAQAVKRLDKCIYSLEYLKNNQPFRPLSEFSNSPNEMATLRQEISAQLSTLASTADQSDCLATLRSISRVLSQVIIPD